MSRSSTERPARRLRIGRVGRAHGLKGEFVVSQPSERSEMLVVGQEIAVGDRPTRIEHRGGTAQRPIVKLDGFTDREAVEGLHGQPLTIDVSQLGGLEEGEHLIDDLVGLKVVDGDRPIGEVIDVLVLPANEVLEVRRADRQPLLVPLVSDAIRMLDPDAGLVDVDLEFLGES